MNLDKKKTANMDYISLGANIRKCREKQKLTQEKVAEIVGVSAKHISNIEVGRGNLSLETFVGIVNALNASADTLLCGSISNSKQSYGNRLSETTIDFSDYEWKILSGNADTIKAAREKP